MTRSYELTVLFAPDITSDEVQKVQNKVSEHITSAGGKISKVDVWGRKPLSYRIQKREEAFFVLFFFTLDSGKTQALEQSVQLTEGVIRHLLILSNGQETV